VAAILWAAPRAAAAAASSASSQQPAAHTKTSQSLREIEHSCFLERSQQQQEASQFCLHVLQPVQSSGRSRQVGGGGSHPSSSRHGAGWRASSQQQQRYVGCSSPNSARHGSHVHCTSTSPRSGGTLTVVPPTCGALSVPSARLGGVVQRWAWAKLHEAICCDIGKAEGPTRMLGGPAPHLSPSSTLALVS
jgi:hypothetical protein